MCAGMFETLASRHVGEVTGYTTGLWEDRDCANCIDRFDALVGTAGCCDGREQAHHLPGTLEEGEAWL